ncbi:MAG TPA: sulfotransferase [Terriglobales bacterium]|nr:sulfotransferase [Terriglobales bacterium]
MYSQQNSFSSARSRCPVFVVGCHRSGTNLLYDTLLSAGGFAIYRGYLPIHKMLIPRFGSLNKIQNRKRVIQAWIRSKGFRRSGLDAGKLSTNLLAGAKNGGEFIRIVMDEIASSQNASRWGVYDPDNVLYMHEIKSEIPEALFIHIVRDGRDIALSLKKMGEFRPFPWNRKSGSIRATALYWKWMVEAGRENGKAIPNDYIEVNFEELVAEPQNALRKLSAFLDHDLDYERIQAAKLGRLREPNSSFQMEGRQNPVNRWKESLSPAQVADIETLVGDCLQNSGYSLTTPPDQREPRLGDKVMKYTFPAFLTVKRWVKINTPAGMMTNLSALER